MSLRTARESKSQAGLAALLGLLASTAALSVGACGEPEARVVARFPPDASTAAGGTGATGGDAPLSDTAGSAGAEALAVPAQRGRVKVVGGKLVTDLGTPLRGLTLPVDTGWALPDLASLTQIAEQTGLNTLHVYLENSSLVAGSNVGAADSLVLLAQQAGLYVEIGYGTGTAVVTFDQAKLTAFWKFYAQRYAAQTHVLYEIQNGPELVCSGTMAEKTLAMERSTYATIRAGAPDTHVVFFSTNSIVQPSVMTDAITRLGATVDWSNESFGLDSAADCPPFDLPKLVAAASVQSVPLLMNQLPAAAWGAYITQFEQAKIGWIQYQYFARSGGTLAAQLTAYRNSVTSEGVTWCPERGTFPQDSSTCRQ
jgi:Cellulase (glycosyl hydrolase family 5)